MKPNLRKRSSAAASGGPSRQSAKKRGTFPKVLGSAVLALGLGYLARRRARGRATAAATVQELLLFVNDRIAGYERAVAESQDAELRGYYKQLANQSQQFATYLNTILKQQGGRRETGTTLKGRLYRGWMDAKAALANSDENSILSANIYGEEWTLQAYQNALADQTLTGALRQAVERQQVLSQNTCQHLKNLQARR